MRLPNSRYQIVGYQIVGYQIISYQIGVTKNPPNFHPMSKMFRMILCSWGKISIQLKSYSWLLDNGKHRQIEHFHHAMGGEKKSINLL